MKTIGLLGLMLLCSSNQANAYDSVIYGKDDRVEVYSNVNPYYASLARSTAAMIPNGSFKNTDREEIYKIQAGTLAQRMRVCPDQRFANQLAAANCSGFLVAPNLLVTAGHCITSQQACDGSKWVFGYGAMGSKNNSSQYTHRANVYSCVKIVKQKLDNENTKIDFAVIQLDRNVLYRNPLRVRMKGKIRNNAPLVVIGHPSGLPTKAASGANVRMNSNPYFFQANLDTFGGNSGSAVFNAKTGVVEGILVRGETDYVMDEERGCRVVKQCADNACRGEDVTRITVIKDVMKYLWSLRE